MACRSWVHAFICEKYMNMQLFYQVLPINNRDPKQFNSITYFLVCTSNSKFKRNSENEILESKLKEELFNLLWDIWKQNWQVCYIKNSIYFSNDNSLAKIYLKKHILASPVRRNDFKTRICTLTSNSICKTHSFCHSRFNSMTFWSRLMCACYPVTEGISVIHCEQIQEGCLKATRNGRNIEFQTIFKQMWINLRVRIF